MSAALAFGLTIWVFNDAIRHHTAPTGWASTLVVVLFMGAIQLLSLGVIGEYIRLIFLESKQRPTYIVAELKRHEPAGRPVIPRGRPSPTHPSAAATTREDL